MSRILGFDFGTTNSVVATATLTIVPSRSIADPSRTDNPTSNTTSAIPSARRRRFQRRSNESISAPTPMTGCHQRRG